MNTHRFLRRLTLCALALFAAVWGHAAKLNVFAAASLSEALEQIRSDYEAVSDDEIRFALGASSVLARQIQEGAPADLFFSADLAKMDALTRAGLVDAATVKTLLSNTLVIIVPKERLVTLHGPEALTGGVFRRLALARTETVPSGLYAREYLRNRGLWEALRGKVIELDNVRAVLAAIEAGNADAGIVYRTDALISQKVVVAYEIPKADAPRILYPAAVVKESTKGDAARRFLDYLASAEARRVFLQFGFQPPP